MTSDNVCMILSFRHRGLARRYERRDRQRMPPELANEVELVLARLDVAAHPADVDRRITGSIGCDAKWQDCGL